MERKIITAIWGILFLASIISLYIFTHEATHAIRLDSAEMMCFGLSENPGYVYHYTSMNDSERFNEEVIANIWAVLICLTYLILTGYMIVHLREA